MGVFDRIFAALAAAGGPSEQLMIDSAYLKGKRCLAATLRRGLLMMRSALA